MEGGGGAAHATLTLPHALRQRCRQRVRLDNGQEAGLYLPRGSRLRDGDRLLSADGLVVEVRAARETVSRVSCADALALAGLCYHLGNRHVEIQLGRGWVAYLRDPVLDGMVRGLGFEVDVAQQPFEPLPGAYHAGGAVHA